MYLRVAWFIPVSLPHECKLRTCAAEHSKRIKYGCDTGTSLSPLYNIFMYNIFQQAKEFLKKKFQKKGKKTNSGFWSNVRSLFHNLDYMREKAEGFWVIYTPLYEKQVGISFSSHLYQAGTPWADRSSEVHSHKLQ